jgi:hypothetical protein
MHTALTIITLAVLGYIAIWMLVQWKQAIVLILFFALPFGIITALGLPMSEVSYFSILMGLAIIKTVVTAPFRKKG